MNKEELLKRQEELKKEFNLSVQQLKDLEAHINQLTGAFNEIDKLLKEEKPDENKT